MMAHAMLMVHAQVIIVMVVWFDGMKNSPLASCVRDGTVRHQQLKLLNWNRTDRMNNVIFSISNSK